MSAPLLTAILPTRNRPDSLPGQLRLLRGAPYRLIIADSSDAEGAARIRAMAPASTKYRSLAPDLTLYDKLTAVLEEVPTPFVVLIPVVIAGVCTDTFARGRAA